ncbi:MAG: LysR substrate-binding domain-containing protein, partial [Pseudomonadota bacterium]
MVAPTLDRFRRASPEARLSLIEGTTASLERDVEQGGVDVAFLHPPLHAAGLSSRDLDSEPLERRMLHPVGESGPPVGVPRHKAPVLMGELDRLLNRLTPSRRARHRPRTDGELRRARSTLLAFTCQPALFSRPRRHCRSDQWRSQWR